MVHGGFFGSISNTIKLMKSCVRVLKKDKELILFPIMAAIFVISLLGFILGTGSIDLSETNDNQQSILPLAILIFGANFIIVFFNSALISAALERLRGGDPNVSSGISYSNSWRKKYFLL